MSIHSFLSGTIRVLSGRLLSMLQNISIRDFAIVPQEELEFVHGFTAITGETGAGKSLIVDALGLLSGNRADTDLIRQGADKAQLSAEFELPQGHPAVEWLRVAEMDDGTSCLLRRVISRSGRSRAWINGTPVTLNQLQDLGALLIEIHGQNEHIRLNQTPERYRLLDTESEYQDLLKQVSGDYRKWSSACSELERLRQTAVLDPAEIELLSHQLEELESNALPADEIRELENEHRRLTRGSEFMTALESADQELAEGPSEAGTEGIVDQINRVITTLKPALEADDRIEESVRMLKEAAINCDEARQNLQRIASKVDLSPQRLQMVEGQLSQLHDLARKHRVELEELPNAIDALAERIENSRSLESRLEECTLAESETLKSYHLSAKKLHKARAKRANELGETITSAMQGLAMEGGCFKINVEHQAESAPSDRGSDKLSLLVSGTAGVPAGPLSKVASGGELSRISLAIKVARHTSRRDSDTENKIMPVQVFDEVDAGVGGDAANAVGQLLRTVADAAQTLCVTHLAQVAACAHQQVKITKSSKNDAVTVNATPLATVAREEEIARMLSGKVSDNSLAHARELIENSAA
ncbi:MAG TPA: DNA repair protein RecN [Xanthomonadales bacterium]|nr:DNA repair protein RecN [Xanthomonadales bacterium]